MVNAFWLDRDLELVRRWLVDRHVTSSVFECAMVLTTAVQQRGYGGEDLYFTHPDHPLTRWAAGSLADWRYLRRYTELAHEEWRYRWDHGPEDRHASWAVASSVDPASLEALDWPREGRTDPPQVTGRWTDDDYVEAYRRYYANEKRALFRWTKRERPPWLDDYLVDDGAAGESRASDR